MPDSLRIAPGGGAACVVGTTSLPTRDGWSLVGGIEDLCPQCSGNLVFRDRSVAFATARGDAKSLVYRRRRVAGLRSREGVFTTVVSRVKCLA
jgi:hypothetical protein